MEQAGFDGMPRQMDGSARPMRLPPAGTRPSDQAAALGQALAALLDAMPQAALLVDARFRLRHANAAGLALLRRGDGLCLVPARDGPGRLSATQPASARRLRLLLVRAAAGLGGWMRLACPSGMPGRPLLVLPLPGAAGPLVGVLAGGAGPVPASALLREAFGLTAAQAQVLCCIAAGAGVPGAAAALGLSAETVRTHLARCFDATGVRSQAALAALVAGLPQVSAPG